MIATERSDRSMKTPVIAWLEALPAVDRDALGRDYARAAFEAGAVVRTADGGDIPIPPLLTPEPISRAHRALMERDAHALVKALSRLTRFVLGPDGEPLRAQLFRAFGPLETEGLATFHEAERLATARVDYLVDIDGNHRALEVNATIPAMQGYSDAIAEAFLRVVGSARGLAPAAIAQLLDDNGRNTDDLLASLRAHFRRLGGRSETPSIVIVARAGDAQLGELRHYANRFSELGHPTTIAIPADLHFDRDGRLTTDGKPIDLIYRHVFARRLDPASDFARACLAPARHFILNPLASHLEVKGMLGWLSPAATDEGDAIATRIGLSDSERDSIRRALPWTRVLSHGATRGPANEPIADLAVEVANDDSRFVLKRSWDYGGRSVFLGGDHDDRAAARAGDVMEAGRPLGWQELVRAAVDDPRDAWVVQERVIFRPRPHLIAGENTTTRRDLYVDCSIYTNLGADEARPSGGASRAAPGKIVNILGGGGLAPLLLDEVIARL